MIELETPQIVLVRFAAAAVLADHEPRNIFEDFARPQQRSRRDLFLVDRAGRCGERLADQIRVAADREHATDRLERRPARTGNRRRGRSERRRRGALAASLGGPDGQGAGFAALTPPVPRSWSAASATTDDTVIPRTIAIVTSIGVTSKRARIVTPDVDSTRAFASHLIVRKRMQCLQMSHALIVDNVDASRKSEKRLLFRSGTRGRRGVRDRRRGSFRFS